MEEATNVLDAAIAALEEEKQRRRQNKIDAGELVCIELTVAVTDEAEFECAIAKAKADKLAELRTAGENREIHFDVLAIATGVARYENFDESPPTSPPALDSTNK